MTAAAPAKPAPLPTLQVCDKCGYRIVVMAGTEWTPRMIEKVRLELHAICPKARKKR